MHVITYIELKCVGEKKILMSSMKMMYNRIIIFIDYGFRRTKSVGHAGTAYPRELVNLAEVIV